MDPAEPARAALRRYGRATDPLDRLRALVEVQRATGPALAALVAECREHGNGWAAIGDVLRLSRTTMHDQTRAGSIQAGPEREELSA